MLRLFFFANFAVKGARSRRNRKTLTAKDAKKSREVREEIQIEPSTNHDHPLALVSRPGCWLLPRC
jgi:hypothetical protein